MCLRIIYELILTTSMCNSGISFTSLVFGVGTSSTTLIRWNSWWRSSTSLGILTAETKFKASFGFVFDFNDWEKSYTVLLWIVSEFFCNGCFDICFGGCIFCLSRDSYLKFSGEDFTSTFISGNFNVFLLEV
jgi:hypothetical protein